jgi:hypothetical protein
MRSACIWSSPFALAGLGALSLSLAACASEGNALDKKLAKLQEELTRVQSQTDRMAERLDAMELRQATEARAEERVAAAAPQLSRPKLKVVRVESDGEPAMDQAVDGAPADDSGPRVVIQGEGKSLETRSVPGTAKPAPKSDSKSDAKKSDSSKATPK